MIIYQTLHKIFTDNPEKWWTTRKLKKELERILKYQVPESEFNREFMILRESLFFNGKKILHWKDTINHYYALSDKKILIAAHNHLLNCSIKRNQRRIVNK